METLNQLFLKAVELIPTGLTLIIFILLIVGLRFILNKKYTEEDLSFFEYPPPETGPVELYELKGDPREELNIADNRAVLVNQLIRTIEDLYSQARKRKPLKPEIDEDLKEQLRALGYIK